MPKLAANLSFLFAELPFLERFAAAADAGFGGVETLFPYDVPASVIGERLASTGLTQVLLNAPPGDWKRGERGLAAIPGREAEFRRSFEQAIEYATATRCRRLHVMAGSVPEDAAAEASTATYVGNLRIAGERAAALGIEILIEPLSAWEMPRYHLRTTAQAVEVLGRVGLPNVRLQLDLYHCQITEGDLARRIRALMPWIGHVQIAGNPGRHEPDRGEIHYPFLLALLDELGYEGWVGCEYRPFAGTWAGLGWARAHGVSGARR